MAQLAYKEALDLAIFALNTLISPEGSSVEDCATLDKKADDVLETLVDIRTTIEELPEAKPASVVDDEDLRLSFSPFAIREHFEGDDDPTDGMSDEELREVGWAALTADSLYEVFHRILSEEVAFAKGEALK